MEIEELPKTALDHIEVCIIPEHAEERDMADLEETPAPTKPKCRPAHGHRQVDRSPRGVAVRQTSLSCRGAALRGSEGRHKSQRNALATPTTPTAPGVIRLSSLTKPSGWVSGFLSNTSMLLVRENHGQPGVFQFSTLHKPSGLVRQGGGRSI
jgi:hypothetical protein